MKFNNTKQQIMKLPIYESQLIILYVNFNHLTIKNQQLFIQWKLIDEISTIKIV